MAQRTHTPLHTGDESPSCGLCCRRARLKLTAPTATLDTPSPISSTESTKRLPIIWPLVHILPRSSFLPGQSGKPTFHLLSSTIFLTPSSPCQTPKLFFLHQWSLIRKDWISRAGDPLPWPGQRRKSCSTPWHVLIGILGGLGVWVQERRGTRSQGFRGGAEKLEADRPGALSPAREALSRVLPRPASPRGNPAPSSSCQPSGSRSFPRQGDALGFPEMQSQTAPRLPLPLPLVSSPLFSRPQGVLLRVPRSPGWAGGCYSAPRTS